MQKTKIKCKICGREGHYQFQCWQRPKKTKTRKYTSDNERKKLIKELDKYFSLYIRWYYANPEGLDTCYTCGRTLPVYEAQCGHYIKRGYYNTRWELSNCRVQCKVCNEYKGGNYSVYEPKIKRELGVDEVQKLWDKAYSRVKIPTYELDEKLKQLKQDYKHLIELRRKKGWKC